MNFYSQVHGSHTMTVLMTVLSYSAIRAPHIRGSRSVWRSGIPYFADDRIVEYEASRIPSS
jgi:hypothetical protein